MPRAGTLLDELHGAHGNCARETVAHILTADPSEVVFTSGGTEANNLAVFGLAGAESAPGHVISECNRAPGNCRATRQA